MSARLLPTFWQDRPTLVTGATGLLGGWLVPRLLAAGADVVCLVRDWVPQSELILKKSSPSSNLEASLGKRRTMSFRASPPRPRRQRPLTCPWSR